MLSRMCKTTACLFAITFLIGPIFAQDASKHTDVPAPPTVATKAPENTVKDAVYKNDDLKLAFFYPSDLVLVDAKAVADRGHRAIYGNDPESDPEHAKSEKCVHSLMMADVPEAAAAATLTLGKNGKPYVQITPSPVGSILFAEIDPTCLPKKMKEKDINDALGSLASMAQKIPGMTPIDQQVWYEVGKHKVHFSAAQGRLTATPQGGQKIESSQQQMVATASVESNGHFVVWMITANSEELFNRLLASKVQFSGGAVVPLFPFTMGNGPAEKLLP